MRCEQFVERHSAGNTLKPGLKGKLQNARCADPLLPPISATISRHERPCARRAPSYYTRADELMESLHKSLKNKARPERFELPTLWFEASCRQI
jgi:hypothetical protein